MNFDSCERGLARPAGRLHAALAAGLLARLLVIVAAAVAFPALADVVKCIDADGNITYQDIPCDPGQAGRNVAMPKAETNEDTGPWEAAARDARIVRGMPKRWVLRARGTPTEIRPAGAREDATEIWRYAGRDRATLVGFTGPTVSWVREDALRRTDTAAAPPAPTVDAAVRGAHNRRFVIAGRYCEHVFAEIGPPDRQEAIDAAGAAAATKNYYEPQTGDPQMRTVFTCAGGKVAEVERTVVR